MVSQIIAQLGDWTSPRLHIRFVLSENQLDLYRPDGQPFLTYGEIAQQVEQERQRAEQERQRAEQAERARLEAVPRLLALGLGVDQIADALGLSVTEVQAIAQ